MDSGESGPESIKKFIESKVQPFCLLGQTLFLCITLYFITNWLPVKNPKNPENTPVLRGIQAKYVSWERVK